MDVEKYKGFEIELSNDGVFRAVKDGETEAKADTLKDVKKAIEKLFKIVQKQNRFVAFFETGWGEVTYKKVTVTSINPDDESAWIIDEKGSREKVRNITNLIKATSKNTKIIGEINQLKEEIRIIEAKIKVKSDGLIHLDEKETDHED